MPFDHALALGLTNCSFDTLIRHIGQPDTLIRHIEMCHMRKRKSKVGGKRYDARSRGRSSPDTLVFLACETQRMWGKNVGLLDPESYVLPLRHSGSIRHMKSVGFGMIDLDEIIPM